MAGNNKTIAETIAENKAKAKAAREAAAAALTSAPAPAAEPEVSEEPPFDTASETPAASTTTAVVAATSTSTAVANSNSYTFDDFSVNDFNVDHFVKASNMGLIQFAKGDAKDGVDEILVAIKLNQVVLSKVVRASLPNNKVEYFKTMDRGQTEAKSGLPWNQVLESLQKQPGLKLTSYTGMDVPMRAMSDVVGTVKKTMLASEGEILGHSTSPSEERNFLSAFKAASRAFGADAEVLFKLKGGTVTNKDNQVYGVLDLELVGPAE